MNRLRRLCCRIFGHDWRWTRTEASPPWICVTFTCSRCDEHLFRDLPKVELPDKREGPLFYD